MNRWNRNIYITVLKYFVQETAIRTALGFTVVGPRGRDRCEKKTNNLGKSTIQNV